MPTTRYRVGLAIKRALSSLQINNQISIAQELSSLPTTALLPNSLAQAVSMNLGCEMHTIGHIPLNFHFFSQSGYYKLLGAVLQLKQSWGEG